MSFFPFAQWLKTPLQPFNVFGRYEAVPSIPLDAGEKFPYAHWHRWQVICQERWNYFTAQALHDVIYVDNKPIGEKYPLHINPVKTFAMKHNYVLWGEINDGADMLVQPRIEPRSGFKKEVAAEGNPSADMTPDEKIAKEAEEAIEEVFFENRMRAVMFEQGLLSQFLGGCVFAVRWQPGNPMKPSGIVIDRIVPDYFWGEPDGSDYWNLRCAWVIQPITVGTAREKYGVKLDYPDDDHLVNMLEYWDRTFYRFSIDGKVCSIDRGPDMGRVNLEGVNEFGFVPFVYIPHERAGEFHGLSLVDALKDIELEYNARMADGGDAVRAQSKLRAWVRNIPGSIKPRQVANDLKVMDLGSTMPDGEQPEMGMLASPQISSEMNHFNRILFDQMRRDGFVPPVADGEDEGSQRSALTLAFRMWPLTSHIRAERQFWTEGLNILDEMILLILALKNPMRENAGEYAHTRISKEHLGLRKRQAWAPMIPRDREELVNEMVIRSQAGHVSDEHAIEMYGDVDDIQKEIRLIHEKNQKAADMATEQAAKQQKVKMQLQGPKATAFTE